MTSLLFILLAAGTVYYLLAVARPLERLTRYQPRSRQEPLPLGGLEPIVPSRISRLGVRLRDLAVHEAEQREQLNYQRKLSSSIFDSLDSGLVLAQPNLNIVFANGAFREWFCPRGDYEGRSLLELCLHHEVAELSDLVSHQLEAEPRTLELEVYVEGKLQRRFFRVAATPAEVEGAAHNGRMGVLFVFEDVTRLRELETIRRDFVANASHELRTPLSILKGYLENLQDGAMDDRELAMKFLKIMEKHCDKLASIVKDLLTVSRLESFTFSLEPEVIDLRECVDGVAEQLQPLIRSHGVEFSLDLDPEPFRVRGDRFCFDQIFFNLMENSIKHNAERELRLTVYARMEGNRARIEFRDNGIGIPQQDQPFVFNRFYRVTRGRTTTAEGTGLGLSIVKHAVEAHGGEVSIESRPGYGTTIQMVLPNAASAVELATAEAAVA